MSRKRKRRASARRLGVDRMATERPKRGVPEGLWIRCTSCKATVYKKEVEARHHVCPECDHHFTMPARDRIAQLLDEATFEEWDTDLRPCDPLNFVDRIPYHQRLVEEQARTGMLDAAVTGRGCWGSPTSRSWRGVWAAWWAKNSPVLPSVLRK